MHNSREHNLIAGCSKSGLLGAPLYAIMVIAVKAALIFGFFAFPLTAASAAAPPAIITYQGKLLVNNLAATTTQSMKFVLYNALTGGTALYTATGSPPTAPDAINVTPTNGIFIVNLGDMGTNSLSPTLFQTNQNVFLEVTVGSEILSPRKQITAAPFAFNAKYLDGAAATSTASSSTYIPISDSLGNFNFNSVTSTGLTVSGTSTLATTTIGELTVTHSAAAQAVRDALGWVSNQMSALKLGQAYSNGGFSGGATPGNLTVTSSDMAFFNTALGAGATTSYQGPIFDGRYLYFIPRFTDNGLAPSGLVLRYDTTKEYTAAASWSRYDVGAQNAQAVGFGGAVFDGRYIYFISAANGQITRYDTRSSFTDAASWGFFDSTLVASSNQYYAGAVFDGRYVYFIPQYSENNSGDSQSLLRYDTTGVFSNTNSWAAGALNYGGNIFLRGAVFDGRYIYFIPRYIYTGAVPMGVIMRFDTTLDPGNNSAYVTFDLEANVNANSKAFSGAVFDGRYIYFTSYNNQITRYDTSGSFTSANSYTYRTAVNYVGGVFDGRFVYFTPYTAAGTLGRYDTALPFTSSQAWSTLNLTATNAAAKYFYGAAFDGRYVYFPPFGNQPSSEYAVRLRAYGGGVDSSNSLAKIARGSDLYITPSSTVLIGTSTMPTTNYQLFIDAGASTSPGIGVNGYIKAAGFMTGSTTLDLAEVFPVDPACAENNTCPGPGDVVCLTGRAVAAIAVCTEPYSRQMVGVISANPGFTLGDSGDRNQLKLALAGRIPLKVSLNAGPIKAGDRLTSSAVPGLAQKAAWYGPTVAIALEDFEADDGTAGYIMAMIKLSDWSTPSPDSPAYSAVQNSLSGLFSATIDSLSKALTAVGLYIKDGVMRVVELVAETIKVKNITAEKLKTRELCLDEVCLTAEQMRLLLEANKLHPAAPPTVNAAAGAAASLPVVGASAAIATSTNLATFATATMPIAPEEKFAPATSTKNPN